MPAGVSWFKYLTFSFSAFVSMFVGAQLVHTYYRPLDDLDELLEQEKKKQKSEMIKKSS